MIIYNENGKFSFVFLSLEDVIMKKKINNIDVNYTFHDIGSDITLVFLHGWGQNIQMMQPLENFYVEKFNTLLLDLPGFGESSEPDHPWTVYEYASFLHEFLNLFSIQKVILLGHSFGGKVSLVYASMYPVQKLVCFGSPYCKEMKKLPFKNRLYKSFKKVIFLRPIAKIMKNFVGSKDYKNASEIMRGVLVQTVNLDIAEDVKKITCPTLFIWGSLDTAVPVSRAYELEKLVLDSGVVVYEGATHYAYLERLHEVHNVLDSFFEVR